MGATVRAAQDRWTVNVSALIPAEVYFKSVRLSVGGSLRTAVCCLLESILYIQRKYMTM
jgi:hypothetical protein